MKTAVIGEDADGLVVYNRALVDLARHYRFRPRACRPYRAKTKGKVERLRRDNQDENRATIRMRMRRRGDYEGRAKPDRRNPRGGGERPGGLVWR